jgi:hypothetical protein
MLEETNKALTAIRDQNKMVAINTAKRRAKIAIYKKYFKWGIVFSIILCIFLFPTQSATLIGNWIHDFFGTIYRIVFQ